VSLDDAFERFSFRRRNDDVELGVHLDTGARDWFPRPVGVAAF
jgi:hypothetical protein